MSHNRINREARARATATGESYTRARRAVILSRSGTPRITVVGDVPRAPAGVAPGTRWGIAEPDGPGWRITVVPASDAVRPGLDGVRVRVDYTTPGTWEPAAVDLPPAVWERAGRWLWAVNGWAVDEPGTIASAPPVPSFSPELPYEVRYFPRPPRKGWAFGVNYSGSQPDWTEGGWCETRGQAVRLAEAYLDWDYVADHVEIWGPDPDGNGAQVLLDAAAAREGRPPLPRGPWGKIRGTRPEAPPAPVPAFPVRPGTKGGSLPDYHLRVWNPDDGWHSAGWFTMRQYAAIAGAALCVGGPVWPFGDIYGPGRGQGAERELADLLPDRTVEESQAIVRAAREERSQRVRDAGRERPRPAVAVATAGPAPWTSRRECWRGCPPGECYHGEPLLADVDGICRGCGGDGECYCDED